MSVIYLSACCDSCFPFIMYSFRYLFVGKIALRLILNSCIFDNRLKINIFVYCKMKSVTKSSDNWNFQKRLEHNLFLTKKWFVDIILQTPLSTSNVYLKIFTIKRHSFNFSSLPLGHKDAFSYAGGSVETPQTTTKHPKPYHKPP